MIALNETQEYAAEIPFTLPLAADPLTGLTGWAFTLGEVQIRLPGAGSWINVAISKIVEKGYGRFCARLSAAQCATTGAVALLANVSGSSEQPYVGVETIGELGGDVLVGGTGFIFFYLPNSVDPVYGVPVSGADFVGAGTLRICLPNDVYRDATPSEKATVLNLGNGCYAFPLTTALTATRGKVFLYAEYPGAQRFEGYSMILGVGAAPGATPTSGSGGGSGFTPVRSPIDYGDPEYVDHILGALNRLPEQFRTGTYEPDPGGFNFLLGAEL